MATIKQIAALAGVSRGTVDRVLNNRGVVNEETAAKIREIVSALQYSPNKIAKTLAVKKKNIKLGYIMYASTSGNPFFDDVVTGIKAKTKELEEYSVSVEIRYSEVYNVPRQLELIDELVSAGVQGLAITPVNHPSVAARLKELYEAGIPVVTVNSDIDNSQRIAYVGSNYEQSGKTAGGLMRIITNGKANVGIVIGSHGVLCHEKRVSAFTNSVAKHCPDVKIVAIAENNDDDFKSFSVTKTMLTEHPEINALFLASAGVYGACRAVEDLNLQKKIKIISFDCVPSTRKLIQDGVITATIAQQPFKQGALPLEILFNYLGMDIKPESSKYYTDNEIKIRENL